MRFLKVWLPATLLFTTGVLTGLGLGRLPQFALTGSATTLSELVDGAKVPTSTTAERTSESPVESPTKSTAFRERERERSNRMERSASANLSLRTPGAGRLWQFRRILSEMDLDESQRTQVQLQLRESEERLKTLLKPLQPDAARELRALRQRLAAELTPTQKASFENLLSDRTLRQRTVVPSAKE